MTTTANPIDAPIAQFDYFPGEITFAGHIFADAKLPDGYVLHQLAQRDLTTRWLVVRGGEQVAMAETSHAAELASSAQHVTYEAIALLRKKAWAHAGDQANAIGATTP